MLWKKAQVGKFTGFVTATKLPIFNLFGDCRLP